MQGDEAAAERGRGATPGRSRGERALAEGLASAKAGNWEAAAEAFRLAASLEPRSAEVCFRLGWALWHQAEEIKPTLTDLSVGYLAHLAGFDAVARQRSGRFSAHKRRLRDAVHALRDALQRDPAHARARYYLARALRDLGYREEALTEARRAAELDPSDGEMAALVRDTHGDAGSVSQPAPPTEEQAGRMGWADVVLSPRVKRELRQVQLMLEQPDLARELALQQVGSTGNPVESLSQREFEVFVMLAKGKTVNEIAEVLFLSPRTVGTHLYNIKQKLGAGNAAELTLIAIRNGLIEA